MTYDEVRNLELFDGLPDQMLRVLVDASDELTFQTGDVLWNEREPAVHWWVLLEGRLEIIRHVGRERAVMGHFTEPGQWGEGWAAFDPHGVNMVTGYATTAGRILRVPVEALRSLVDGVPVVRHFLDGLFHTAREIESSTRQREALVALGTLASGLAHELNNPAAAAVRAVESLEGATRDIRAAARRLADQGLSAAQSTALDALVDEARPAEEPTGALGVADREEALSDWMAARDVDREWILAPALAAASLDAAWCERVLETVDRPALQPALELAAASATSLSLMREVRESTQRVSSLVDSVKSYSQMDRGSFQRVDVREGIRATIVVLAHRLDPGVEVVQKLAEDLPEIDAYPGELNQVWTSLIDNAIDAMAGQGTLEVTAITEGDHVVVTVSDTGVGMAPDVLEHAFDIFFTTKAVGMGTGLGLALARRVVVERHSGDIKIDSSSAGTRVRVFLPTPARISDPAALPDGLSRSGHDDE